MQLPTPSALPPGSPSIFSCPECGGSLFEFAEGGLTRYRCRTGHGYSPESLVSEQAHNIEASLYAALRALEENAALSRQLAERARKRGSMGIEHKFITRANQATGHAETLRHLLTHTGQVSDEDPSQPAIEASPVRPLN